MTFHGTDDSARAKIVVDATVLKQISSNFQYMHYNVSYFTNNVVVNETHKLNHMCGIIRTTLKLTNKKNTPKVLKGEGPHHTSQEILTHLFILST